MQRDKGAGKVLRLAQYFSEPSEIAEAAARIRDIARKKGLETSLEIGEFVLHRFFAGSPSVWRERRRNKNNSVRRLAEHPDCPLSRSSLNNAIAIYVAVQTLPCVQTFGHIGTSHIVAVSFLDSERQQYLLEQAEEGRWSVRELGAHLRLERETSGTRRGRPLAPPSTRLVSGVRTAVSALRRAVEAISETDLAAHETEELAALAEQVAALQKELRFPARALRSEPCLGPPAVSDEDSDGPLESGGQRSTG